MWHNSDRFSQPRFHSRAYKADGSLVGTLTGVLLLVSNFGALAAETGTNVPAEVAVARSTDQLKATAPKPKPIRIATWDLHDLWHESGVPLRGGMIARRTEDFQGLGRKVRKLDADVIALQGVGSPRAARMLFPARDYFVVFSRELAIRQQRDRDILSNPARRRVYNAIAIRRAAKLRMLAREQILETADPSPALGAARPQGHSALAVKLRINKRSIWVVTSRLLAGCKDSATSNGTEKVQKSGAKLSPECTALRDQVLVLNAWKSRKATKQEAVVMAVAIPQNRSAWMKGKAIPNAFKVLTTSDPVKVTLAYNARKRIEARRRAGARKFVLTNSIVGPSQATSFPVQQPNTVPLTGPSRPPRQRLAASENETKASSSNFVVDALSDFAKAALSEKRKASPKNSQQVTAENPETNSLAESSVAALKKLGDATQVAKLKPKTSSQKTIKSAKTYFVRFPERDVPDGCKDGHIGMNFLLVDKSLHRKVQGVRFDTLRASKTANRVGKAARADCAVYVDIPRQKS